MSTPHVAEWLQLHRQKNNAQEQIEINHSPSVISRNDQNQSNNKRSNTQCSQETQSYEKLRMQCTLISSAKKKISPKSRCECNPEITVAEI